MDTGLLISDIERLSHEDSQQTAPSLANAESELHRRFVTPLAARWLSYEGLQYRQVRQTKQTEQVKAIVYDWYASTNVRSCKDEIENMQDGLARLYKLLEQRQVLDTKETNGAAEPHHIGKLMPVITDARAALNDALFKRQQFMIATSDYSKLPDKMADEIIRYLTSLKPTLQKK